MSYWAEYSQSFKRSVDSQHNEPERKQRDAESSVL
jgi:hypothetical protein